MEIYNTQQLLFSKTQPISAQKSNIFRVPDSFYTQGYALIENLESADQARETTEQLIASIDHTKLPIYKRFDKRIQLAKADIIPICTDSVETSFQALHFDMGQPITSDEDQTMYVVIALYFPQNTPEGSAKTRLLPLNSLLSDKKFGGAKKIEKQILTYVDKHGDGWADVNTHRLSCFARVIDAVAETEELSNYRDKTMAQWFAEDPDADGTSRLNTEHTFYAERNVPIDEKEQQIQLQPGQLLIIDNMRAVHGRIGKRHEQEIYQLMYGVEQASPDDITAFRKLLVSELSGS